MILGLITYHVHPEIVEYISSKNTHFKDEFARFANDALDLEPYFYENSDCIFPAYRRPINKEKVGKWKNNINEPDQTILNDNTVPRHIWAFLTVNKAYSGGTNGMWSSSGLDKFELAHVFGHKVGERFLEQKAFENCDDIFKPYGLFTSASNVVLIPKGFAKPTDQMESIKLCFYKRHIDLYGENLPEMSGFRESLLPEWYSDISWLDPLIPNDWKSRIDRLLLYRAKHLKLKYAIQTL
ncbi:hypothetical protein AB6C73_07150 [Vibrio splendidus]